MIVCSSSEAKYQAGLTNSYGKKFLLKGLALVGIDAMLVHCENVVVLHIAFNPVCHERIKHVKVVCHFTQEKGQKKNTVRAYLD